MKAALAALGVVAALLAGAVTVALVQDASLRGQVGAARAQISADRRELAAAAAAVRAAGQRINGQHRDLITCGDLQHLQMAGVDSAGDDVSTGFDNGGGPNAVSLPGHCINQ